MKYEAGGVFVSNENDLSTKTVIIVGVGIPASSAWVAALNVLQNSIIFRPACPKAGPIGGDGFAWPAGTCSFM